MKASGSGAINIREATREDLPEIIELWKPFMDHHSAIHAHYARTPDAHTKFSEYLSLLIGQEGHAVFVAEEGRRIVGFAKASLAEYPPVVAERSYGAVTDMAVKKTHRRRGVGRQLLSSCERWLKGRGIRRVEVRVLRGNPDGEAFWSSQGYEDFLSVKWKSL